MDSMPQVDADYPAPPREEPEVPLQGVCERHTDPLQQVPPIIVEKPVERIVEVEKIVERVIEKPVEVEKVVIVEKPVEKIVLVDRPPSPPEHIIEKTYVYLPLPPEQRTETSVQPDRTAPAVEVKTDVQPNKKEPEKASGNEVRKQPELEVKQRQPEVTQSAQPERKPEEKDSRSEKKSSGKATKKLKVYNGLGRRHTAAEIDEILDGYIMYGELPEYVSERQRSSYRHHVKLPERRQLLEQAGLIKTASRTKKRASNVVPMAGAKTQRKRRASSSI